MSVLQGAVAYRQDVHEKEQWTNRWAESIPVGFRRAARSNTISSCPCRRLMVTFITGSKRCPVGWNVSARITQIVSASNRLPSWLPTYFQMLTHFSNKKAARQAALVQGGTLIGSGFDVEQVA
jgi:hypothetical protein